MGRVLTNNLSLGYSIESALGVAGAAWKELEPNTISAFGAKITTEARNPISRNRQRRKGVVTDLDSTVEFEHDVTLSAVRDFSEGFLFSTAKNGDMSFMGGDVTSTGYSVTALSAGQAGRLLYGATGPTSLLFARGFATPGNNGLKALGAAAAATDTELKATGLTAETAADEAEVELAGVRAQTGDLAITKTGTTAVLSSGNNSSTSSIDFTELGLTVGQFIHVGGLQSANQFAAGAGFARVRAIAGDQLTLDKLGDAVATDTGAGATVDILFGRFVRNVPVDHVDFLERSFHFELASPNLMPAGATGYEYAKGNFCDTIAFTVPLSGKATAKVGFVGTDTEVPTDTQKAGASAAVPPNQTAALNSTSDVARLRITDVDEAGLTTDFKSLSITIGNNVGPEKVIGQLGAKYMNAGNFDVDIEAKVLFTNPDVITRIRENATVSMDFAMANEDGALYVDIASMTLGGGGRELPENESVILDLTAQAFEDAALGTSISFSTFPVVPS